MSRLTTSDPRARASEYLPLDPPQDAHVAPAAAAPAAAGGARLLRLVRPILTDWRRTLLVPATVATLVALLSLLLPKEYRASASFYPSSPNVGMLSGLSGVARSLGVVAGGGQTQSPEFYANLLTSRSIVYELAASPIRTSDGSSVTPMRFFAHDDLPPARALAKTAREITSRLRVHTNKFTGVVSLDFMTADSTFAAGVVNRLLAIVNDFNVGSYQSNARATRQYLEERQEKLRRELAASEAALLAFHQTNRSIGTSPSLQLELERRRREISLREQAYLGNAQQLEQAVAEEVRATPTVTVIDRAAVPAVAARPMPVLYGLLAGILAFAAAVVMSYRRPSARGA